MNSFKNLFKTTKDLFGETLGGLKSLLKASDIETKTQSKKLYELEVNFTKNVGKVETIEAKLATAELSLAESTKAKDRVDLLTREKAEAEIVWKYIENNKSFLDVIKGVNEYKAVLFSKNPDLKSKYYKEKYDNTLTNNTKDNTNQSNVVISDQVSNVNTTSLSNATTSESSTDHQDNNDVAELAANGEIVTNNDISEPEENFDSQITKLKAILAPNQTSEIPPTETHNPRTLLDIDKNVDNLISLLKPVDTFNHSQCQTYLDLIKTASKSICDEVENKNNLEMNIAIAEHIKEDETRYTTEDVSGDFYKNFLYHLDAKINNRTAEQKKASQKNTKEYNNLAKKIEKNIKYISDFFDDKKSKKLQPKDYETRINQLTKNMHDSVLALNKEIQKLNIDSEANMDNNSEIAKYNTLDVAMNKGLNTKIEGDQGLNAKITKALSSLEKGKNDKETQTIKEIDDLLLEIDRFRADIFDKTQKNISGVNIYNDLQKKIQTAIKQNTQTNYSFSFYSKTPKISEVKKKINELTESNNKLNSSLDFIEKENKQLDIKKNLPKRSSTGFIGL